ncbi:MAG TPA: response regulator, partial [Anaeromyxobacteraceae bacterium]|nr:response regulator [Anaeromyxobacteraceae bacterium]
MPKNLLLADDSITIQKVVGIIFATEDYRITAVDNGEDALRKARESRPDIILADVVMPRMNGYEVCEAVKGDPQLAGVPVVLLAGTFEAFDEARARAAKADGHIAKPFESQSLLSRVKELVEGAQPAPAPQAYPRAAAGPTAPASAAVPPAAAPRPAAPQARPPAAPPPASAPAVRPGAPRVAAPPAPRPPAAGAPVPPGARPLPFGAAPRAPGPAPGRPGMPGAAPLP